MSNENEYRWIVKLELTESNYNRLKKSHNDIPFKTDATVVDIYSKSPNMTPLHCITLGENQVIARMDDKDYHIALVGDMVTAEFHRTHCSLNNWI